jgi:hypothetical protein
MKIKELRAKVKEARKKVGKMKKHELVKELGVLTQIDMPQSALQSVVPAGGDVKKLAKESSKKQVLEPVEASISVVDRKEPKPSKVIMKADKPTPTFVPGNSIPPQLVVSGKPIDITYGKPSRGGTRKIKSHSPSRMTRHKKHHIIDRMEAEKEAMPEPAVAKRRGRKPAEAKKEEAEKKPASGGVSAYRAFIKEHCSGGKMTLAQAAKLYSEKKKA